MPNQHIITRKLNFHTSLLSKLLARRRDYTPTCIRKQIELVRFIRSL